MMRSWLLGFCLVLSSVSSAFEAPASAVRGENQDWKEILEKWKGRIRYGSNAAVDVARPVKDLNISLVKDWESIEQVVEAFEAIRDHRFLPDPRIEGLLRRSTWMFPDDGCFARAQLMQDNLEDFGYPEVNKLFVFGNLKVRTTNTISGSVSWWYHVAPVLQVEDDTFVLDPSIDPYRPLLLEEWLGRMGNPNRQTASVCDGDTYIPYSNCYRPDLTEVEEAELDQGYFLEPERQRLKRLGRDAEQELGEFPPWLELAIPSL